MILASQKTKKKLLFLYEFSREEQSLKSIRNPKATIPLSLWYLSPWRLFLQVDRCFIYRFHNSQMKHTQRNTINIMIFLLLLFIENAQKTHTLEWVYPHCNPKYHSKQYPLYQYLSASHQTRLDTKSMTQRSIIEWVRGEEGRALLDYAGHQPT